MSVSVIFALTEAGVLAAILPLADCCTALRARMLAAEQYAETQGSPTFSMLLSPLEQGFILGALANTSCHFSGDLRARVQGASVAKLNSLNVASALSPPGPSV